MNRILEKLTKEDLIKVVANMHDTIQEWNNGYGLPKEEAETLIKIGSACVLNCSKNNDFKLPTINENIDGIKNRLLVVYDKKLLRYYKLETLWTNEQIHSDTHFIVISEHETIEAVFEEVNKRNE